MSRDLTLKVTITADGSKLVETVEGAGKSIAGLGDRAKDGLARVGLAIDGLAKPLQDMGRKLSIGVTAPLTAAFGAAAALTRGFANTADEIAKSARGAGMAAGSFQELGYALGQVTNVDAGEMTRGFEQINATLGQAVAGDSGAIKKLEALGLAVEDLANADSETVFNALLQSLDQTSSAADAAAKASDILGERIGRSLGPQLRGAGDDVAALRQQFVDLGLVIDDEVLAQAEAFNDMLDTFSRELGGVSRELGAALLPLAIDLLPVLRESLLPAFKSLIGGVADAIRVFQEMPEPVRNLAAVVLTTFAVAGPVMLAVGGFIAIVGGIPIAIGAGLLAAAALFVTFKNDIAAAITDSIEWVQALYEGVREWMGEKLMAAFQPALDAIRKVEGALA